MLKQMKSQDTTSANEISKILDVCSKIIYGKREKIELAIITLIAGEHLLIEDLPGVGKTTLVKLLSEIFNLQMGRVQFTNDLLPSDIIGSTLFNSSTNQFVFKKGALFSELVLADELNRAPPKTQSALLQAMEERKVSIDGKNYDLPKPFFVVATQNPGSQVGTFELPESQLDRFAIKFKIGYPDKTSSINLFKGENPQRKIESLDSPLEKTKLEYYQNMSEQIHLSDKIVEYIYNLVDYSRTHSDFVPLSNRFALDLIKISKVYTWIKGREFVTPEDVQYIFPFCAGHRLVPPSRSDIDLEHSLAADIIANVKL